MNIKQAIAEYWRCHHALVEAEAIARRNPRRPVSRKVAAYWRAELGAASDRVQRMESQEIVIDGELPAPDLVPDNVVPFPGETALGRDTGEEYRHKPIKSLE